ncbi:FkbM family methyltransferase [Candidatus Woesearchaeota archaeon]|nr:FkbM family methyltransferase [Candidatus Woesearchaeota archaeon]
MNALNKITNILTYIYLLKEEKEEPRKLFFSFIKLGILRLIKTKRKKIKVFDYKILFYDFKTFHEIFLALFVNKEYYFKSDKKKPKIIDCGSNIGLSILFFKKKYPGCSILSFEPDKDTFKILKKNLDINKIENVVLVNKAVSSKIEKKSFYIDSKIRFSPGMSLFSRLEKQTKTTKKTTIHTTKLSKYITEWIDFMKIDIEGSEIDVLLDLDKTKKISIVNEMVIEYHHNTHDNNKLSKILEILESNNFDYEIQSLTKTPFKGEKSKFYNLLIHAFRKDAE